MPAQRSPLRHQLWPCELRSAQGATLALTTGWSSPSTMRTRSSAGRAGVVSSSSRPASGVLAGGSAKLCAAQEHTTAASPSERTTLLVVIEGLPEVTYVRVPTLPDSHQA